MPQEKRHPKSNFTLYRPYNINRSLQRKLFVMQEKNK